MKAMMMHLRLAIDSYFHHLTPEDLDILSNNIRMQWLYVDGLDIQIRLSLLPQPILEGNT